MVQLLNQTSGLADYQSNDTFLQAIVADPLRVWEPEELVDLAVELGQVSPPGAAHVYANTNFVLAGLIVESVTGQAFHDVLREDLLSPLGLEHTWLEGHEIWDEPTAHGYVVVDAGRPIDITDQYHASQVWSAGAMVASAGDLRRWIAALLNSDFLAPESQAELAQFVPAGAIQYGLGVFAVEQDGYVVYGHNGAVGGFQSAAFIHPATGTSVAVLQNRLTVVGGVIDSDPTTLAVGVIAAVADGAEGR